MEVTKATTQAAPSAATGEAAPTAISPTGMLVLLERAAVNAGFKSLRRKDSRVALLECDELRLRLSVTGEGSLRIEGLLPREQNLAEFLLETNDDNWWTGIQNGLLTRRFETQELSVAVAAIHELRAAAAVVSNPLKTGAPSLLSPLGNGSRLATVSRPWIELGRALLGQTRALAVRGSLADLWAWLAALVPAAARFMVRSTAVVGEPEKVASFLRDTACAHKGICVAVNVGCLPSDAWRAYFMDILVELHLADPATGARVVFFQPAGSSLPLCVPIVELPDFASDGSRLTSDGALRRTLMRDEDRNARDADGLLRAAKRSVGAGHEHGTTLTRTAPVCSQVKQVSMWFKKLEAGLSDIVGHMEVKRNLARSVARWMAKGDDAPPMVLAFIGPSGVGKNYIAQALAGMLADADFMDTRRPNYVTINMGTPGDSKQWSLTGVGAGHVGAERKGLLEAACETPGFVITFDELDKCVAGHADPQGFLVSILENAGFRNGHGHWVAFSKGIVILTLNCGLDANGERFKPIGFSRVGHAAERRQWVAAKYRDYYETQLIAPLRGRVHQPYFFGELTMADLKELASRELHRLKAADAALGLEWGAADIAKTVADIVAVADASQGARGLMREVERFHERMMDRLLQ